MAAFPFYTGKPDRAGPPPELPPSRRVQETEPGGYLADPGLIDAVNVALLLGQPLLLTGEPGTGKTQLAYSLAAELRLDQPLKFETKSTTVAVDLFYHYNALARFHAAHANQSGNTRTLDYLTFNALGRAIVLSNPIEKVADLLAEPEKHTGPQRSVVLIDEVDKAPRDFPNDILNEIETMKFHIPELDGRLVECTPDFPPVVIITSNSEKNLPDAFLRRCVYFNIPFPDEDRLKEIVLSRIKEEKDNSAFLKDALGLFYELRNGATGLRKKPATAELLGWVRALRKLEPGKANPLRDAERPRVLGTLAALAKNPEDQERARGVAESWFKRPAP